MKIVVTRRNEWMNSLRDVKLYANGQKIGEIANGQSLAVEVQGENVKLHATIDWARSNFLEINDAEGHDQIEIELSSFLYRLPGLRLF